MVETVMRLVCDRCGAAGPTALESENPADLARAEGWEVNKVDEDLCPKCKDKKED